MGMGESGDGIMLIIVFGEEDLSRSIFSGIWLGLA